jgi:uncharacterized protein YxjI
MSVTPAPGESYTIRRKVFKIFGASFHIYDEKGGLAGFCKQKAFKLREDIKIYTDESCGTILMSIAARSIIDFGATYDITLGTGERLGSLRRKGLKSSFLRDEWLIFDEDGKEIGIIRERGSWMSFFRRYVELVALFSPQVYDVETTAGVSVGVLRRHLNPFIYRLGVRIEPDTEKFGFDDLYVLAMGCLIAAVEGTQESG